MENIKLLPHQIKPIEYIVSRCKGQHGLILNHYMGTGKTITGITFLKNFPSHKKTIILPRGLEAIWKSEAKKLNLAPESITFITFDKLINFELYINDIEDSICIVDEAHNLYTIIDDLYDIPVFKDKEQKEVSVKPRLINFINLMYSTKKILLLTGTLIKNQNISDIRWLINIAAGKERSVVPFNQEKFMNTFSKINKIDKLWMQVFKPFLLFNPFNLIPKDLVKKLPINEKNIVDFVYSIVSSQAIASILQQKIKTPIIDSKRGVLDIMRYTEILSQIKNTILDIKTIRNLLFMTLLLKGTKMIFKYAKAYYEETYDFIRLDTDKLLKNNVNKYISYFNYKFIDTKDYPSINETIKNVKFTTQQLALLIKILGIPEKLEDQEYVDLELNNNLREAELFKSIYLLTGKFVDKGRIIGNLYSNPEKFKEILKIYQINNKPQTVVYSNFYNSGILLFSVFLKSKNIKHVIFDHSLSDDAKIKILTNFKNKKIHMLLLHPDFYEGISIAGCKYLHVLEPIIKSEQREQLYARVVRYHSHFHLPKKEQYVNIYQWGCTLLYDLNKILHTKEFISQWLSNSNPYISVIDLFKNFKDQLSPDDRILRHYNKSKNFKLEFAKTIQAISIDNSKLPLNCCIWTPDDSCSNKKLISCATNE